MAQLVHMLSSPGDEDEEEREGDEEVEAIKVRRMAWVHCSLIRILLCMSVSDKKKRRGRRGTRRSRPSRCVGCLDAVQLDQDLLCISMSNYKRRLEGGGG